MNVFSVGALLICLVCGPTMCAQDKVILDANDPASKYEDKRVFGVLPNYRTAEITSDYHPLSARYKFNIAFKDSFDFPIFGVAAGYAGLYQLENSHPQFGQGTAGYFRRLGTALTDQITGNLMTEGLLPVAFKEDPRYFRKAEGSAKSRTLYALSRIFVTKTDAGNTTFNFAEVIGNGVASGVGLAYYKDDRDFSDFMQNWAQQLATDAFSQVLKEFWPDMKRRLFRHGKDRRPLAAGVTNNTD